MKLLIVIPFAWMCSCLLGEELADLDWDELRKTSPWSITEVEHPVPVVQPGVGDQAPSDAIVLFDGSDLSEWSTTPFGEGVRMDRTAVYLERHLSGEKTYPVEWTLENGELVAGAEKGSIATKRAFGDIQLHIEWLVPVLDGEDGQSYGNSGVFLMGMYELQVLNSYENYTYANGQAASIYKQHSPLVNASKAPGEWQSYDVIFTAPRFSDKGTVIAPARMTVLHNGVLVQNNAVLQGPTAFIGEPYYLSHPEKLPIVLQDHDNPVRFRNIWVREL